MEGNRYRVIDIISSYQLIIDFGTQDGAAVGDEVIVFDDSIEVKNPVTGKILGHRTVEKEELVILDAHELFSICIKNYKIESRILDTPKTERKLSRRNLKLNVDDDQISGLIDYVIRLGDSAKIIKAKG